MGAYGAACVALRGVQVMTDYGRARPDNNSIRIVDKHLLLGHRLILITV